MGAFKSVPDPEQNYRRELLAGARKGKAAAKEELQTEFHVRMYTAAERRNCTIRLFPKIKRPVVLKTANTETHAQHEEWIAHKSNSAFATVIGLASFKDYVVCRSPSEGLSRYITSIKVSHVLSEQ